MYHVTQRDTCIFFCSFRAIWQLSDYGFHAAEVSCQRHCATAYVVLVMIQCWYYWSNDYSYPYRPGSGWPCSTDDYQDWCILRQHSIPSTDDIKICSTRQQLLGRNCPMEYEGNGGDLILCMSHGGWKIWISGTKKCRTVGNCLLTAGLRTQIFLRVRLLTSPHSYISLEVYKGIILGILNVILVYSMTRAGFPFI